MADALVYAFGGLIVGLILRWLYLFWKDGR